MSDSFHEATPRTYFVSYSFSSGGAPGGVGNSALLRDRGICSQEDVNAVQAEIEGTLIMSGVSDPKVVLLSWKEYDSE